MLWGNGRFLLITHDHWSQLTSDLGNVQFRNAAGTLLAKLDLYRFKQMILSRNGGTMILSAPDAIQHLAAVIADEFWLVHRQEERLVVSAVHRVGTELKNEVAVWRLKGQTVTGGDSGGEVWINGRLIATTWAAIMIDNTVTYERKVTDLSLAALLESTP